MRDYELVMIVSPEIADEDVPAAVERVSQFIIDRGGTIVQVDQWGRRRLAYPIRHFSEGTYVLTQFKSEPPLAAELEASLQISEEILRHLLVRSGKEDDSDP